VASTEVTDHQRTGGHTSPSVGNHHREGFDLISRIDLSSHRSEIHLSHRVPKFLGVEVVMSVDQPWHHIAATDVDRIILWA
jgi:hypothetical protein